MVHEFNTAAQNQGIPPSEMHAVVGNLVSSTATSDEEFNKPEYFNFDIAVVGLGFHHFEEPALAAERLAKRLKKGGVLMIIDFLPHGNAVYETETGEEVDGKKHAHDHSHSHSHGHDHSHSHTHGKEQKIGSAVHTVAHHGFAIEDVKKMFDDAGAGAGFEYVDIGNAIVFTSTAKGEQNPEEKRDFKRSVFMARGTKL